MSNRFHNKWHRHNHHTYPLSGEPDGSHDPIASRSDPFMGDFVISGAISASAPLSAYVGYFYNNNHDLGVVQAIPVYPSMSSVALYGDGNSYIKGALSADAIWTPKLYSTSSVTIVQDIYITELSGFTVIGATTALEVPPFAVQGENLVFLSGVGISALNWASFAGDLCARNIMANSGVYAGVIIVTPTLDVSALNVAGCVKTDCISAFTLGQSAINIWNNLDLHGYSISGIGNSSLAFDSGARITSTAGKVIILDSNGVAENLGCYTIGGFGHSEGAACSAAQTASHAEGWETYASGVPSHAEGQSTSAVGIASHAEGILNLAFGDYSHVEGAGTQALSSYAHAEGIQTIASEYASHAEGAETVASGDRSHAEGFLSQATGNRSHAEGQGTLASGGISHAEGAGTIASGPYSHAEGGNCIAAGSKSHAAGTLSVAMHDRSWIWNGIDIINPVSSVGDGTFNVYASSIYLSGDVTVNDGLIVPNISTNNISIDNISSYTSSVTAIQIYSNLDMNGHTISNVTLSSGSVDLSAGIFTNLTATDSFTLSAAVITNAQTQTLIDPLTSCPWALTLNINGSAFAIPLWLYSS